MQSTAALDVPVVELRTFAQEDDVRARGISCVVVNHTGREIEVWKGYDGARNQLLGLTTHPIRLLPPRGMEARMQRVKVQPGLSETVFTLPMNEVFFFDAASFELGWRWGWAGLSPRSAPPISPFHSRQTYDWEAIRAESAEVGAAVEVDGRLIESKSATIRAPGQRVERVRALVRFESARVLDARGARRYELHFRVIEQREGTLTKSEQTLRLDPGTAEPLMRAAGSRRAEAPGAYTFSGSPIEITFSRITEEGSRSSRLVISGWERRRR